MFEALAPWLKSPEFLSTAALGGFMVYGANQSAAANEKAAMIAADSAKRQTAAIRENNLLSQQRFEQTQKETAPALTYAKTILASDPHKLTPQQSQQVEEARRDTVRGLSASGLIGSGRAVTDAVRKVEGDLKGRLIDNNLQRADAAASGLAGQYFSANVQRAMIDQNQGGQLARVDQSAAENTANAGLSTARVTGAAMGDIASLINSDLKRQGRESTYGNELVKNPGEGV